MNAYLERKARIGVTGRKSEARTARDLNLRLTPASGAAIVKGDMTGDSALVEAKSTTGSSMGLRYDWLAKIADEATMVGKSPALSIRFTDEQGAPRRAGRWVCIPERDYQTFLQLLASDKDRP